MRYTQIPLDTFKKLQRNAGVLTTSFNPATGEIGTILGATTGGMQFNAAPSYSDFGDDIDNCPKNMKELKNLDSVDVTLSGTLLTIDTATAKKLMASADISQSSDIKIVPRRDLLAGDFHDLWWIGDYSDDNSDTDGGFCAIHIINALNTGGFQIKTTDKGKGQFPFTFTGHVSMNAQDTVPYEVYIQSGSGADTPGIFLNKHVLNLVAGDDETLVASVTPSGETVTWEIPGADSGVATVNSSGKVTAVGAGDTILTASITVDSIEYTDTCTVIVTAAQAEG